MLQWRYVLETLKMVSRKYCKVAKKNVALLILIPHSPFPLHSLFILPTIAWIPMSTPRPQPSHCPPDLDHVKLASSSPIPHADFWLRPIDSQPWGCANYAKAGTVFALWHCLSRTPSSVNRAFFQNYFFLLYVLLISYFLYNNFLNLFLFYVQLSFKILIFAKLKYKPFQLFFHLTRFLKFLF